MQQDKISVIDKNQVLYCKINKNIAQYFCNNPDCQQNSIICMEVKCSSCIKHQHCPKIKISALMHKISDKQKPLSEQSKKSKQAIQRFYDQIIQQISLNRQQFLDFVQLLQFDEKTKLFIELINQGQYYDQKINGELIANVLTQLEQTCDYQLLSCNELEQIIHHLKIKQKSDTLLKKLNYISKKNNSKSKQNLKKYVEQYLALSQSGENCRAAIHGKRIQFTSLEKYGYQLQDIQQLRMSMMLFMFRQKQYWENFKLNQMYDQCYQYFDQYLQSYEGNCQIERIENLDGLSKLQLLVLNQNKIKKIQNLSSLVQLKKLVLSNNKIETIQNLQNLKSLQELRLNSNPIKIIQNILWQNHPYLIEIWLHDILTQMTEPQIQLLDSLSQARMNVYCGGLKQRYKPKKQQEIMTNLQ